MSKNKTTEPAGFTYRRLTGAERPGPVECWIHYINGIMEDLLEAERLGWRLKSYTYQALMASIKEVEKRQADIVSKIVEIKDEE